MPDGGRPPADGGSVVVVVGAVVVVDATVVDATTVVVEMDKFAVFVVGEADPGVLVHPASASVRQAPAIAVRTPLARLIAHLPLSCSRDARPPPKVPFRAGPRKINPASARTRAQIGGPDVSVLLVSIEPHRPAQRAPRSPNPEPSDQAPAGVWARAIRSVMRQARQGLSQSMLFRSGSGIGGGRASDFLARA